MRLNDPDRLFPADARTRDIARALYQTVVDLPIISPHGHCDPRWFAQNDRFENPAALFVIPDHYVFRMLISQGIAPEKIGIPRIDGEDEESDPRKIWRLFAENFHLFRGTPSAMWLNHSFEFVFGMTEPFNGATADHYYNRIEARLARAAYRPRVLFERFGIEVLATTEGALDDLRWHRMIGESDWQGRVVTTYRPDAVVDPGYEGFSDNIARLGALTGEDCSTWQGYLGYLAGYETIA